MESPSQYQNNAPNTSTKLDRTWQWITLGLIVVMALATVYMVASVGGAL